MSGAPDASTPSPSSSSPPTAPLLSPRMGRSRSSTGSHPGMGLRRRSSFDPSDPIAVRRAVFSRWINAVLASRNYQVYDIFRELHDGIIFGQIAEEVSGEVVDIWWPKPTKDLHFRENVDVTVAFLNENDVLDVFVDSQAVVEGNRQAILDILWGLVRLDVKTIRKGRKEKEDVTTPAGLLQFLSRCSSMSVEHLAGLHTGDVLCALINHMWSKVNTEFSLIDMSSLNEADPLKTVAKAMKIADSQLGVPYILDPDLLIADEPDFESCVAYFSSFLMLERDLDRGHMSPRFFQGGGCALIVSLAEKMEREKEDRELMRNVSFASQSDGQSSPTTSSTNSASVGTTPPLTSSAVIPTLDQPRPIRGRRASYNELHPVMEVDETSTSPVILRRRGNNAAAVRPRPMSLCINSDTSLPSVLVPLPPIPVLPVRRSGLEPITKIPIRSRSFQHVSEPERRNSGALLGGHRAVGRTSSMPMPERPNPTPRWDVSKPTALVRSILFPSTATGDDAHGEPNTAFPVPDLKVGAYSLHASIEMLDNMPFLVRLMQASSEAPFNWRILGPAVLALLSLHALVLVPVQGLPMPVPWIIALRLFTALSFICIVEYILEAHSRFRRVASAFFVIDNGLELASILCIFFGLMDSVLPLDHARLLAMFFTGFIALLSILTVIAPNLISTQRLIRAVQPVGYLTCSVGMFVALFHASHSYAAVLACFFLAVGHLLRVQGVFNGVILYAAAVDCIVVCLAN